MLHKDKAFIRDKHTEAELRQSKWKIFFLWSSFILVTLFLLFKTAKGKLMNIWERQIAMVPHITPKKKKRPGWKIRYANLLKCRSSKWEMSQESMSYFPPGFQEWNQLIKYRRALKDFVLL